MLAVDVYQLNDWSDKEVVERWLQLFKGTDLDKRFVDGELIEAHVVPRLKQPLSTYLSRHSDIYCEPSAI